MKYFEYKWELDKNMAFDSHIIDINEALIDEMYTSALYFTFLRKF